MAREWQLRFNSEESRGPRVCAVGGVGCDARVRCSESCLCGAKSKGAELFKRGEENVTVLSGSTAGAEIRIRKNMLVAPVEGRLGRVSPAEETPSGLRSG